MIMLLASFNRRMPSVGLPLAFTFNLLMNHYFGALIYALPWYPAEGYESTYLGFEQTLYGMAAFAMGSLIIAPWIIKNFAGKPSHVIIKPHPKLIERYLQIGLITYFLLGPILWKIPTIATFVQSAWNLLITSLCLLCWKAWIEKKPFLIFVYMALALLFPFFTSFNSGFLNYGVRALMAVLFFVTGFFKPRWFVVVMVIVSVYLGLSLCETYFRDRNELRENIWYGQQSTSERIGRVLWTLSNFEFLDLTNQKHLDRIDARLNQNDFVGKSVIYLGNDRETFAHGSTFTDAIIALVPRIVWPDKPVYAGSGNLVTRYTGQILSETTAWGVGYVMEFYINFGTCGVVIGFLILGILIRIFDFKAARRLVRGDWQGFTLWFLPACGLTETVDTIPSIVASVLAAVIFCIIIHHFLLRTFIGFRFFPGRSKV